VSEPLLFYTLLPTLVLFAATVFLYLSRRKYYKDLEEKSQALETARKVNKIILEELDFNVVAQKVADAIPGELDFATGVLAMYDDQKKVVRRIAASRTPEALEAIKALSIPFNKIEVSVNNTSNLMARAIRERKSFVTEDVYDVLGPMLNKEEAGKIQQIMSTKTTLVYPIYMRDNPIGVFVASTKKAQSKLTSRELQTIQDFVDGAAIALQHATLYQSISKKTDELRTANTQLKELDRLKNDFVSIASHELRTPMTAIRSYVWLALNRSDMELTEKMKKYLMRTLTSTERLISLVNDMLNISRIESKKIEIIPESFDLFTLIDDVIAEVGPKAEEKKLKVQIIKTMLPQVFADQDKVHQILLNLLGNAMKFTPVEGVVRVSFFNDGKTIQISVKDSGVGIGKDDLGKLFQKFGRLDSSYVAAATSGGTGLGLFICKSLVELMGGRIWAESEGLNKGATFSFTLPIASVEVMQQAQKYTNRPEGEAKQLEPMALN
jgi:signal transduction histidine kinase